MLSCKVPLGVQLKNEMYLTEMCDVLDSFTKYVPMEVFGDQLTVARVRGASMLRDPQLGKKDTLKAYVPTIADWHTRIILLEVSYLC